MVGQYQGPDGIAALAVVAPVWNISTALAFWRASAAVVLGSAAKGRGDERQKTNISPPRASARACWLPRAGPPCCFGRRPCFGAFSADGTLLSIARQYLQPIRFAVPLFLINQMLAAWLRNDGAPVLATAAVLEGGVFNIFGDYAFVFLVGYRRLGRRSHYCWARPSAFAVMLGHFFSKKNTLRLVRPARLAGKLRQIVTAGLFHLFHRHRHGPAHHAVQPADYALAGCGRAGGVRRDCKCQHLCAVLRLQCGPNRPAHHFL